VSWFIESWSVLDGLAFAVHRNYITIGSDPQRVYVDPDQVVYVAPPTFVPIPTRFSTAQAATRGNFQEGFTNAASVEVTFESLENIIELVRRVYLAGGATMQGGDETPLDLPPPPDPQQLPPLSQAELMHWQAWMASARSIRTAADRERVEHDFPDIWGPGFALRVRVLCDWIVHALEAIVLQRPLDPLATLDLCAWTSLAFEFNDWRLAPGHTWSRQPCLTISPELDAALLGGLLHRIPCPPTMSHPQFRWLGQHLCVAIGDRQYLNSVHAADEFMPLLLAALTLGAAQSFLARFGLPPESLRARRRAGRWLARELPDVSLDANVDAQNAISQIVLRANAPAYRRRAG